MLSIDLSYNRCATRNARHSENSGGACVEDTDTEERIGLQDSLELNVE